VEHARVDAVRALLWDDLGVVRVVEQFIGAGDRVVFFTDGILDREAPDGSMFEEDRLVAALASAGAGEPASIVSHIVEAVERFAGGHEPSDDQTLVVAGLS